MYRLGCFLCVIVLMVACNEGDPCIEFLKEGDVEIVQSPQCNDGKKQISLHSRIPVELRKDLDLKFVWNIDGQTYEQWGPTLIGEGEKEGSLTISNFGCSIVIDFTMDFDFGGGYVGNTVWRDNSWGSNSSILDANDERVEGAVVELLDGVTGNQLRRDTTDVHGLYLFENVYPGSYRVRVHKVSDQDNFVYPFSGFDTSVDSNFDHEGYSDVFFIEECEIILDMDAGFRP